MSRLACLALLLTLCGPLMGADKPPDWHEVRSPHFLVLTDGGPGKGRDVALRFEQLRQAFTSLALKDTITVPTPLLIIAFRNGEDMRQHVPQWKGRPLSVDGLFVGSSDRNFILVDLSSPHAYEAVAHEYAHLLLDGNMPLMPLWFDEGMAEYYSTLKVDKDFTFGAPPDYATRVLRGGLMPVAQLFRVGRDSKTYNDDGDRRSLFYAQSWLVVHYLIDRKKLHLAQEYARLVQLERVPVEEAIRRAFGLEPKQLDRELQDFFQTGTLAQVTIPIPSEVDSRTAATFRVAKVTPLDAEIEIADLHVNSRDSFDRGVTELENLLRLAPENGRVHRALGYAYLSRRQLKEADWQLRQAAQLLPNDARVHYYAAALLYATGGTQGGDFAAATMKEHLLKAVDVDPEYAAAWDLLGYVYRRDQKFSKAIDAALTAIKLAPREDSYRLNLAYVYLDARQYEDAIAMLDYLKRSSDPAIVAQAEQALAQLDTRKQAPIRTGRFDERARPATYDNPKWQKQPDDKPTVANRPDGEAAEADTASTPEAKPDARPIQWLKGRLTTVSCRPSGAATLTVMSGKKTLQLATPNYKKMVVIGADAFSCSWTNVGVAVNYRASSPTTGDLVSLELQ